MEPLDHAERPSLTCPDRPRDIVISGRPVEFGAVEKFTVFMDRRFRECFADVSVDHVAAAAAAGCPHGGAYVAMAKAQTLRVGDVRIAIGDIVEGGTTAAEAKERLVIRLGELVRNAFTEIMRLDIEAAASMLEPIRGEAEA